MFVLRNRGEEPPNNTWHFDVFDIFVLAILDKCAEA